MCEGVDQAARAIERLDPRTGDGRILSLAGKRREVWRRRTECERGGVSDGRCEMCLGRRRKGNEPEGGFEPST